MLKRNEGSISSCFEGEFGPASPLKHRGEVERKEQTTWQKLKYSYGQCKHTFPSEISLTCSSKQEQNKGVEPLIQGVGFQRSEGIFQTSCKPLTCTPAVFPTEAHQHRSL